jgi:hypothetical protein
MPPRFGVALYVALEAIVCRHAGSRGALVAGRRAIAPLVGPGTRRHGPWVASFIGDQRTWLRAGDNAIGIKICVESRGVPHLI